jgi:CRISPR-associated endonuclease/helicase Cas3
MTTINPYLLWAKLPQAGNENGVRSFHPLVCHMIDVGVVARMMWRETIADSARRDLARTFGLSVDETENWVAYIAALHDIGKASPVFQLRREASHLYPYLVQLGSPLNIDARECPHGRVTAGELRELLRSMFELEDEVATILATLTGGHHGVFPNSLELMNAYPLEAVGRKRWRDIRQSLTALLQGIFKVGKGRVPLACNNSTTMLLAGLISVADWIGSNSQFFPYLVDDYQKLPDISLTEYSMNSEKAAEMALTKLGWLGWSQSEQRSTFTELFNLAEPRPLQRATIDISSIDDPPGIVIIEAPMGEGKTEAALYLADSWGIKPGPRGCYIALPTQATSNQMFSRVNSFLSTRYPVDKVNLQLLHGHASLSSEFNILRRNGDRAFALESVCGEEGCGGEGASVVAAEWFTHRKRGLLAPYGVGTIDQALLAVLQTRHVFVRLFGLSHKVIVIDEVHAYDTYMSRLLERLMEWLAALGSPVILLSATLPNQKRMALIGAYLKGLGRSFTPEIESALQANYPRISWATKNSEGSKVIEVSDQIKRRLNIEWVREEVPLGQRLATALVNGGCAAVICNTVNRAQQTFTALKSYFSQEELSLFHARFLYGDRQERENQALVDFGKQGARISFEDGERSVNRPFRKVLVATQVVEQSLDLDFDLMVTDCAPIDLILQRSGRLHRHQRLRNKQLATPTLWIRKPEQLENGMPRFDTGSSAVYDEHLLLRSWFALRDLAVIDIPNDIERLIEFVYDERSCPESADTPLGISWNHTAISMESRLREMDAVARKVVISSPTYRDSIFDVDNRRLEEDEPEIHQSLQAMTRMVEPSVHVICLSPEQLNRLNIEKTPKGEHLRELLRFSITLTNRKILGHLLKMQPPSTWRKSALLRNYRLLELDETGSCPVDKYCLRVDPELGVVITQTDQEF